MSLKKESRTDVQFHLAALRGDCDRLRQLLDTGKVHIDSRDRDGTTPLILSAAMGHTDCVRELLAQGADPACCRTTGTSALFFAAQGGFLDVARLLLDAGAAIDAPSTDGGTPLFVACQCGHLPVVEELIRRGADVNACMKDKAAPLFIAAQNGHEEVCLALLKAGAAVDSARADRATPLWIAAQCGHDHVVRALLAAGAYQDQVRQVGHEEVCLALLKAGAAVHSARADRATPLWIAAQCGHDHVVRALLAAGAYQDQVRQVGHEVCLALLKAGAAVHSARADRATPLWIAAQCGHDHVVRALLAAGAYQDQVRQVGHEVCLALLKAGAAVHSARADRATPLWIAAQCGHDHVVRALLAAGAYQDQVRQVGHEVCLALLKAGAAVHSARADRATPLWIAAQCGHDHVVRALLAAGAYQDQVRQVGHEVCLALLKAGAAVHSARADRATPLWIAAQCGHDHVVRALLAAGAYQDQVRQVGHEVCLALLKAGAAVHSARADRATPLWIAAQCGHDHVVRALLAAGAYQDQVRQVGHEVCLALLKAGAAVHSARADRATPLWIAAQCGHDHVVRALLAAGAYQDQVRQDGATPLFKAAHKGHAAVVVELLKYKPNLGLLPNGQSALHGAAMFGQLACVKLLARRSDTRLRNSAAHTPAQAAAAARKQDVVAYLKRLEQHT